MIGGKVRPDKSIFSSAMSRTTRSNRINCTAKLIRAAVHACIPAWYWKRRFDRPSASKLADAFAAECVHVANVAAAGAVACAAELEKLAVRYSTLATSHFPSTRAQVELIGSRIQKARIHAQRARDHADTVMSILQDKADGNIGSRSEWARHHANLARQAHLHAFDLLELSLARERRERIRNSRRRSSR